MERGRIGPEIGRPARDPRVHLLTLGVDFHGVICAHPEGEQGATDPAWPEVPGAIGWLRAMTDHYNVHLVSARFGRPGVGTRAVMATRAWLVARGIPIYWLVPSDGLPRIVLSPYKPACVLYVDDRAWRFDGHFPTLEEIGAFKPWNR